MEHIINLKDIKEYMFGYLIVNKIYEIRDYYDLLEEDKDNKKKYNKLIINLKILDYIRDINFVVLPNIGILEDIKEFKKIGFLLNFHVYIDPENIDDNIIMSKNDEDPINIKVIF